MSNIAKLARARAEQCALADAIMGDAIKLRYRLRNAISAPLPDGETDDLIEALAVFVRAAERVPR